MVTFLSMPVMSTFFISNIRNTPQQKLPTDKYIFIFHCLKEKSKSMQNDHQNDWQMSH